MRKVTGKELVGYDEIFNKPNKKPKSDVITFKEKKAINKRIKSGLQWKRIFSTILLIIVIVYLSLLALQALVVAIGGLIFAIIFLFSKEWASFLGCLLAAVLLATISFLIILGNIKFIKKIKSLNRKYLVARHGLVIKKHPNKSSDSKNDNLSGYYVDVSLDENEYIEGINVDKAEYYDIEEGDSVVVYVLKDYSVGMIRQ